MYWDLTSFTVVSQPAMNGSCPARAEAEHQRHRYGGHRWAERREKEPPWDTESVWNDVITSTVWAHARSGLRAALSPSHQSRARVTLLRPDTIMTYSWNYCFIISETHRRSDLAVLFETILKKRSTLKWGPSFPWNRSHNCAKQERLRTTHHAQNVRRELLEGCAFRCGDMF